MYKNYLGGIHLIDIRPHHVLCMHGFRGKGYNDEFVASMASIIKDIQSNKEAKLNIVNNTDAICSKCPNKIGENLCETQESIVHLDSQVIKALELAEGIYSYIEILDIIKNQLTEDDFEEICSNCEWYSLGYCKEGLFD